MTTSYLHPLKIQLIESDTKNTNIYLHPPKKQLIQSDTKNTNILGYMFYEGKITNQ